MSGEKILVVDDEKSIRDTFLYSFDDYEIVTAGGAKEALEILRKPNGIDLVVSDYVMPGMNGLELAKEIKKINPDLKVAIFTGFASMESAVEALRSHVDEFIEKPFDLLKINAALERLIKEKKEECGYTLNSCQDPRLLRAKRFIKRNLNKTITLEDVAKEIFLCPKYFSRLFKEKTRRNFNKYLLQLRVSRARALLKNSGYKVSRIASEVGYQDAGSFMKMFKRLTGQTPTEYRQKLNNGNNH